MSGGPTTAAGMVTLYGALGSVFGAGIWAGIAGREKDPRYGMNGRFPRLRAFNSMMKNSGRVLFFAGLPVIAAGLVMFLFQ